MKKIYRDRWDRKVAGVCGGLGQFFNFDPTIIRLLMIFICIFTGLLPLIIIYVVAWLLTPLGAKAYIKPRCKKLYRSRSNRKISGICGGISEILKVDAIIVRTLMVACMFLTGILPIIIDYFIGSIIIPENPNNKSN